MRILRSYRWRRRLTITAIVCSIAGPLIYLGVLYSSPGNPYNANGPTIPDYVQPKNAPFTASKRRAVHKVLKQFITSAVIRKNVARSWNLAARSLKEGVTRKQWNSGDIPVVPYPAADKGLGKWSFVRYSYTNTVGLEVFLFPQKGSGYSALTADVELVRGHDRRWRVDYWMPNKFHGPPATATATKKKVAKKAAAKAKHLKKVHTAHVRKRHPVQAAQQQVQQGPRTRGAWWALPIALLGLAVALPITIGLVVWWRNKRAMRDYLRSVRTR